MADMRYANCGRILGRDRTLIPKPSRLLTFLKASVITMLYVSACTRTCVSISIYEQLDRFTKSDVNAVPLENILLLISYISNNNMAVARACEVEPTCATLTERKETTVVRTMLLYKIKQHHGDSANIVVSFRIDGDYT